MRKFLLFICLLIIPIISSTNHPLAINYNSYRRDTGILLSKSRADWSGDYEILVSNDSTEIIIDNGRKIITIGQEEFEFMDVPLRWNTKVLYKCVMYECIDLGNLEKVFIYLIEYDKSQNSRIIVTRYDGSRLSEVYYNVRRK